ncbi:MAG: ankyrin repeat domain-containing protein [Flavobacteriaceae bacterium]|nr:ankyrin repeat domain-containing protein [Flavobacteriaceae bacterium]
MEEIFQFIRSGDLKSLNKMDDRVDFDSFVDQRGSTPLILAAYYNQVEIVKFLLNRSININHQDHSGNTALMGACFKGYKEVVLILLEHGADCNIKNYNQATALFYAAGFNQPEIAQILLEKGADTTIKDKYDKTAFQQAQAQGLEKKFQHIKPN